MPMSYNLQETSTRHTFRTGGREQYQASYQHSFGSNISDVTESHILLLLIHQHSFGSTISDVIKFHMLLFLILFNNEDTFKSPTSD
jgi:hypothetical protein